MNTTAMATRRSSRQHKGSENRAAIDIALLMFRQPNAVVVGKHDRLPLGIMDVIKASAGHDETLQMLASSKRVSVDQIQQACQFFLRNLLTSAGQDPYRKLGLERGAAADAIKDHKRWLLKWLHPDRNPSKWEHSLFAQVGEAAVRLEQELLHGAPTLDAKRSKPNGKNRQQRFHPVVPSKRSILKSVLRRVAIVIGVIALMLTVVATGAHRLVLNEISANLFG
jgi:hypothetical protein